MYRNLNYFKHFLILVSVVSGCVLLSAFALLVGIPMRITSSTTGLKMCPLTTAIKKYK